MNHRIEWLASLHERNRATASLLSSAEKVVAGGVEGVRYAAQEDPELIIAAIEGLIAVIKVQDESYAALAENWLESLDSLETIQRLMKEAKEQ